MLHQWFITWYRKLPRKTNKKCKYAEYYMTQTTAKEECKAKRIKYVYF